MCHSSFEKNRGFPICLCNLEVERTYSHSKLCASWINFLKKKTSEFLSVIQTDYAISITRVVISVSFYVHLKHNIKICLSFGLSEQSSSDTFQKQYMSSLLNQRLFVIDILSQTPRKEENGQF